MVCTLAIVTNSSEQNDVLRTAATRVASVGTPDSAAAVASRRAAATEATTQEAGELPVAIAPELLPIAGVDTTFSAAADVADRSRARTAPPASGSDNGPPVRSPRDKMSGPVAALAAAGGPGLVDIVVRYAEQPALFDDEYVSALGGEVIRSYETLDMRAIRIPALSLEALAVEENVDWLSVDDTVSFTSVASRSAANVPAAGSINAGYSGSSVGIAVLDTGVALHTDLAAQIVQYSFLNGRYPRPERDDGKIVSLRDQPRQDLFGHGTHVAGILVGNGEDSNNDYTGSASGATVLSLQVLDQNGGGSMSDVMAALDWLLVYGKYFDIRVVNLSLGKSISESNTTDPLVLAVEKLWDAGMVVVVAGGNDGHGGSMTITSPGNSRKVITVGSLTDNGTGTNFSDDYVSTFSSMGPTVGDFVLKPDLVAPGNRVVAAVDPGAYLAKYLPDRVKGCKKSLCTSKYLEMSGTSMATPMVSAAVARMLDKDPTLSPATVKARLMRSARKIAADAASAGAGLLDVDAALNDTGVMTVEALSPLMVPDSTTNGVLVQDTGVLWGDATWGSGYLFNDGSTWATGYGWTDSNGVTASGYAGTDANVWAKGYGWTDGTVSAKGYGWTDGGDVAAKSFLSDNGSGLDLNDDPPSQP